MKQRLIVSLIILSLAGAAVAAWSFHKPAVPAVKSVTKSAKTETAKPTADNYAGWLSYDNHTYGFAVKYPTDWLVREVSATPPPGPDPVEFAANLQWQTSEKYSETATLEVHTNDLAAVTAYYDNYYAQSSLNQVTKHQQTLKGHQAVSYQVTNGGIPAKRYLFKVGNKTYSLASVNEELNQQRSAQYWADFDQVFGSLVINQ